MKTPNLILTAACLLGSAALARAEPDWSGRTFPSDSWCQVQFNDEFGDKRTLWAFAGKCCAKDAPSRKDLDEKTCQSLPLYSAEQKTNAEVKNAPYYETSETHYHADLKLSDGTSADGTAVRRDGISLPMSGATRMTDPLGGGQLVVVKWTSATQPAAEDPMALQSQPCGTGFYVPSARYPDNIERAYADMMDWFSHRFLPQEQFFINDAALLKAQGIRDWLGCPKETCGEIGSMADVSAQNTLILSDYVKKLREKMRARAAELVKAAGSPADKDKLSQAEADLVACGVYRGQLASLVNDDKDRERFLASLKKASSDPKEREAFVRRWRAYAAGELGVYLKESDGFAGEVADPMPGVKAIEARVTSVIDGKDPADVYPALAAAKPATPASNVPRKKAAKTVESASDWADKYLSP